MNIQETFEQIYKTNRWGKESSGPGTYYENCKIYIRLLNLLFESSDYKEVLDVGCGYWDYQRHVKWINYTGFDLIEAVQKKNLIIAQESGFFNDPHYPNRTIDFYVKDALVGLRDKKVRKHFDLVLIKDVFQHLSSVNIHKLMKNVRALGRPLVLVTTDTRSWSESPIPVYLQKDGQSYSRNLDTEPDMLKYNFRALLSFNSKNVREEKIRKTIYVYRAS